MAAKKLTGGDLRALGYPEGKVIGIAMKVLEGHYKGKSKALKLELMERVYANPAFYLDHEHLRPVAESLIIKKEHNETIELNQKRVPYAIYGLEGIEAATLHQMEVAMKLPVTNAGALMPDAHLGYGLPIGGVLAVNNAVIPYGVGMDIGCRMCLTIYDINPGYIQQNRTFLKEILTENTRFGHQAFKSPKDHEVLEREEFKDINILKSIKDLAWQQIGTSGGGNHFVEFGVVEILDKHNEWELPTGKYLSILSHSGSRGMGAKVAQHYTRKAMDVCKLPKDAKHLAWFDLDSSDGQEYWRAMSLAGDYASACHHQIHERLATALGEKPLVMVENHHNFAWKETDSEGNEVIVHRKGATPAAKGLLGIIPGSMATPGFIVRGKGNAASLNSASHGAGRVMSRRKAKETISKKEVEKVLKKAGVELIGSDIDEAPMVYKDIHKVMDSQKDLVEVIGTFEPRIVRMCGDKRFAEVD